MFKKNDNSKSSVTTYIGEDAKIEGILTTAEPLKIDGTFIGDIKSTSTVIIGPNGFVDGNVSARQMYVAGKIRGDANIEEKTQFVAGGHLRGNILSADLIMEMGASIDGVCKTSNNEMDQLSERPTPIPTKN